MYHLYLITNLVNQKVYVGQTISGIKRRWSSHKSAARHGSPWIIHKAIRKYGSESFAIQLLNQYNTREALDKAEIRHITRYRKKLGHKNVYNIMEGGKTPRLTKKQRRAMSKARMGYSLFAKLNWTLVATIRAKYATGRFSWRALARIYNVTHGSIGRIIRNETYRRADYKYVKRKNHAARGNTHPSSKLQAKDVRKALVLKKRGMTYKAIAEIFAVNKTTISSIFYGQSWTHITGIKYRYHRP
jgi:GIY-YIG catalytic domain